MLHPLAHAIHVRSCNMSSLDAAPMANILPVCKIQLSLAGPSLERRREHSVSTLGKFTVIFRFLTIVLMSPTFARPTLFPSLCPSCRIWSPARAFPSTFAAASPLQRSPLVLPAHVVVALNIFDNPASSKPPLPGLLGQRAFHHALAARAAATGTLLCEARRCSS
mmetsp:Transcript_3669/g.8049  ORF Transcript_3669/g.8049 Transcript_3669/m.8049 type:complete len:165 (+) Transcript_3669:1113-1607(+)